MSKHLVVILLELDSEILKKSGFSEVQFEELPIALADAVSKLSPKAITPVSVYYLSDKEKSKLELILDTYALDFTEVILDYNNNSKQDYCTVIKLDTHRQRQHKKPS